MARDIPLPDARKPFVRSAYNYDMDFASDDSGLECKDPSLAQQQFKDETDINVMMARFGQTGEIPQNFRMPTSQDFRGMATDFKEAADLVVAAEEEFLRIPPQLRARFQNDPQQLMDFIEDGKNREEAIELGLVPRPPLKEEVQPTRVIVVPDGGGTT